MWQRGPWPTSPDSPNPGQAQEATVRLPLQQAPGSPGPGPAKGPLVNQDTRTTRQPPVSFYLGQNEDFSPGKGITDSSWELL